MPDYIVDQETPLPQLPAAFSGNNGPAEIEIEAEIYPILSLILAACSWLPFYPALDFSQYVPSPSSLPMLISESTGYIIINISDP